MYWTQINRSKFPRFPGQNKYVCLSAESTGSHQGREYITKAVNNFFSHKAQRDCNVIATIPQRVNQSHLKPSRKQEEADSTSKLNKKPQVQIDCD